MYLYLPFCVEGENHIVAALWFFLSYFTRSPRRRLNGKPVEGTLCAAVFDSCLLITACLLPWSLAGIPQAPLYPLLAPLLLVQSWQLGPTVPMACASLTLLRWTRREWYPAVLLVALAKVVQELVVPSPPWTVGSAVTACVVSELKFRLFVHGPFNRREALSILYVASVFAPLNPVSWVAWPAATALLCRQMLPRQSKAYQVILVSLAFFFSGMRGSVGTLFETGK